MANNYFKFKQFTISQDRTAFKVGTDGVLLGAAADLDGARNIIDIGTGTGLIAIMAAQRCDASVTAIESDRDSCLQACENVNGCKWYDRINVINSDFNKFWQDHGTKYDVIISNPPWFRESLQNPDARKASSRHAVSLDAAGLLAGSARLLAVKGSLQVILPYAEGSLFIAEASGYGLFCSRIIKVKPNPAGPVKRLILKLEREKRPVFEKFITIETGIRHHYTEEYKELMKDYYLKF